MSTRKVIVASTAANVAQPIEAFTGRTFADLKRNSVFASLYQGGVEAILSPGNVTLTRDDATLPETDFKVFLVPTKNKAGITPSEATSIGYAVGQAIAKAIKMSETNEVDDLKNELIATVEDFFGVDLQDPACAECDAALEEAKRLG